MIPFFLDGPQGRLFAILHASDEAQAASQAILFLPPFAEENNRSRHMMAAQARAFAAAGVDVLLLDPFGTGDSDGEFGEASWNGWRQDVIAGIAWLRARGAQQISLCGLRLGAALAADISASQDIHRLVLWQPITNGRRYLRQFLRLKVAAELTQSDGGGQDTKALEAMLTAGESLEIAGYLLTSGMAAAISDIRLGGHVPSELDRVIWLEISSQTDLSPATQRMTEDWRRAGAHVSTGVVQGPQFWTLMEPEDCPALIDVTMALWREPQP